MYAVLEKEHLKIYFDDLLKARAFYIKGKEGFEELEDLLERYEICPYCGAKLYEEDLILDTDCDIHPDGFTSGEYAVIKGFICPECGAKEDYR